MSLRYRIFRALAQVSIKRPYLVLLCAVALSIASVLYTKARLEFHTGQDDLITPNSRASRDYLDYTREFPDLDGLIVVVRAAPDPARAEHFADALAARLNADHANVKTVFYKIDAGAFADRAMLYMTSADLDALAQKLRAAFPMLGGYAADPSLAGFFAMVNAGIDRQMQAQMPSEMQSRCRATCRRCARRARTHRARPLPISGLRCAGLQRATAAPGSSARARLTSARSTRC